MGHIEVHKLKTFRTGSRTIDSGEDLALETARDTNKLLSINNVLMSEIVGDTVHEDEIVTDGDEVE
jgi:hypothetical protein